MNIKISATWSNLLWFLAAIIVLIDPRHVYEFAKAHQPWSELIVALWTLALNWANKTRPQSVLQKQSVKPPSSEKGNSR
jgi:hypothetical protein